MDIGFPLHSSKNRYLSDIMWFNFKMCECRWRIKNKIKSDESISLLFILLPSSFFLRLFNQRRRHLMKKIFLFLTILSIVLVIPIITSFDDRPLAGRGCCMQRNSLSSGSWYDNGLNLRRCRDLNKRLDGDDLYNKRSGLIYWKDDC